MTVLMRAGCSLFLCCAIAGCTRHSAADDEGEGSSAPAVVSVRTVPVIKGDMDIVVTATGNTDAVRKEKIVAPIAGNIVSLKVLEGSPVARGEVVAVIQPKETRAAITGAGVLLHEARTEGERAEAGRAMDLALSGQNDLRVRSTTSGIVSVRSVTEGELVAENAELMTVVDLSTLVFIADVPLADVIRVRVGQHVTLSFQAIPGELFSGTVDAVNPRSEPGSQTVRVRIGIAAGGERRKTLLRSDMSGVARIVTGKHPGVLIIPKGALLRNDETDAYTVVVATPDSLARIVSVVVGARTDTSAEVASGGLQPGTRVIVEGNYSLTDSTRIAPLQ
jgi:membrane fusion protein (multidrug efflux system)